MAGADQKPILIGYDGSDFAKAAVKRAAEELGAGRRAVIATVFEPLGKVPLFAVAGMAVDPDTVQQLHQNAAQAAGKIAEEGAVLAREAGFEAETAAVEGDPVWDRLVELAEDRDADLIVIGSRGLSGVKHALLGSVAAAVAQHSKRSVLIVHRP